MIRKIFYFISNNWRLLGRVGLPIIVIFGYLQVRKINSICEEYFKDVVKYESHSGWVIDKFIDEEQHNYQTVVYQSSIDSTLQKLTKGNDKSGLIDFLQVGDSISKESGSYLFQVYRKGERHEFLLDFVCDD